MTPPTGAGRRSPVTPSLRVERRLLRSGAVRVGAMDEVGRGSPAGPLHVGLVVVDAATGPPPPGVRDSKLLAPAARTRLAPRIRAWASEWAVGSAGPDEIDALGLTAALRLAAIRALDRVARRPDVVLLDGSHDWLSQGAAGGCAPDGVRVVTRVRADRSCTSVAAASIVAKVERDAMMTRLAEVHPGYGWESNKGYGTAAHLDAIRRLGTTPYHRRSWRLPVPD